MHALFQRGAVTIGALSALLGLAASPGYSAAPSNAGQTPVGQVAADRGHQPTGANRVTHRAAKDQPAGYPCTALLSEYSYFQCPDVPANEPGWFKNTSVGDDSMEVLICDYLGGDCVQDFDLDQGEQRFSSVPPGYHVYIGGRNWVNSEYLTLSINYDDARPNAPRPPCPCRPTAS